MNRGPAAGHLTFGEFFRAATGHDPYPYQDYLSHGDIPDMVSVPTGAGKTEAAVLSMWMWRRMNPDRGVSAATPRRLIYCLPMRTLVEQTRDRIGGFIKNLGIGGPEVITLMGSDVDREYMKRPELDMIIVGTQDMLLSRALNRGYATSPFMWPVEFAAVNNDCMWIMDEVQLMGDGLATSVQLDAFRRQMRTFGPHKTVWMSATVGLGWLGTVDSAGIDRTALVLRSGGGGGRADMLRVTRRGGREGVEPISGHGGAEASAGLDARNNAPKLLRMLDGVKKGDKAYSGAEARSIWKVIKRDGAGSLTLVIVNTVKRAQSLYAEFAKISKAGNDPDVVLAHSRFRRDDRRRIIDRILSPAAGDNGTVVVSTQVVEAGVDMSAKILITESAPWTSMVQRFGRCNRRGEFEDAKVYVIPMSPKAHRPYDADDMDRSAQLLKKHIGKSVSPASVGTGGDSADGMRFLSVLRRRDLLGLFDTGPDLSGGYTDVARYVRSADETRDVHVFWRRWDGAAPDPKIAFGSGEVCPVPVSDLKPAGGQSGRRRRLYRYDHADGSWEPTRPGDVRPGQTLLLHADDGGYTEDAGWDPASADPVPLAGAPSPSVDSADAGDSAAADPLANAKRWVPLCSHTHHVAARLESIQDALGYDGWPRGIMREAAILHDLGKAHAVFQIAIGGDDPARAGKLWGKSDGSVRRRYVHPVTKRRLFFRHEAVSAAAILHKAGPAAGPEAHLKAYVVAAHHGKVRVSMRNPPAKVKGGRYHPHDPQYVAGVPVGSAETIPNFLSRGRVDECTEGALEIGGWDDENVAIKPDIGRIGTPAGGGESWLEMVQGLLAEHGPFRLALLEATLRAADMLASADEESGKGGGG